MNLDRLSGRAHHIYICIQFPAHKRDLTVEILFFIYFKPLILILLFKLYVIHLGTLLKKPTNRKNRSNYVLIARRGDSLFALSYDVFAPPLLRRTAPINIYYVKLLRVMQRKQRSVTSLVSIHVEVWLHLHCNIKISRSE